jgi:suppressor for copper-sensitivity B
MKKAPRLLTALLVLAAPAWTAVSPWKTNPQGSVRLVVPYLKAPKTGQIYLGVEFKPEPGWMVYWKQPGDAGFPPKFDFSKSQGLKNPKILWPRPKFFLLPGDIKEYGYDQPVIYPVQADAVPAGSLRLTVDVNYLTCKESCVPHRYELYLDVPQADFAVADPPIQTAIEKFVAQVPPESENVLASLRPEIPGSAPASGFWWIMLLAFAGGLILNVMPCVLPVLSIKLFGLLQHGGSDRRVVIRDALASAAGIIVSFVIGAVIAITVRKTGQAVGWGIQFQNPGFLAFLIAVLFIFTLNLWGVFEIHLPRRLSHLGAATEDDEGLLSYFTSGMLATLLATPCSAPFLGTAVGFALSQPAGTTLGIFGAAGVGMATPYLLLAAVPQALTWLPRPGAWMQRVRFLMGFLLLGTAIWLGSIFARQVGLVKSQAGAEAATQWVSFDRQKIPGYLAQGKTVFVDVTADWCFTCKYNERFVLNTAAVQQVFDQQDIVLMKADWTNRDNEIGDYLKGFNRYGIPFYALYRPGQEPVVLSEFLTASQVLKALGR